MKQDNLEVEIFWLEKKKKDFDFKNKCDFM